MPEVKSWTVVYRNPLTGTKLRTAVFAPDRDAAMAEAEANNVTAGPYGPPWSILSVTETVFPGPAQEKPKPAPREPEDDGLRSATFYDLDEALDCLAEHPDGEIYPHDGHPIVLDGSMVYDIPENRPHWTVVWEEDPRPEK